MEGFPSSAWLIGMSGSQFFHLSHHRHSLDPDKDRHFVGPCLSPKCLRRLSADDKSGRQQGKSLIQWLTNVLYFPDEFHHRDEWFPVYPPFPPPPPPPPPPPAVEDFADDSFAIFGKLPVYG